MERYEQITQLIYDAIDEINRDLEPEQALKRSPDTVLLGESGKLDSLGFVNLLAAIENNVDRNFNQSINLIDVIVAVDHSQWTVATLARGMAERIGHDQRRASVSVRI